MTPPKALFEPSRTTGVGTHRSRGAFGFLRIFALDVLTGATTLSDLL